MSRCRDHTGRHLRCGSGHTRHPQYAQEQPHNGATELSVHETNVLHSYRPFQACTLANPFEKWTAGAEAGGRQHDWILQSGGICPCRSNRSGVPKQEPVGPIPRDDSGIPLLVNQAIDRGFGKILCPASPANRTKASGPPEPSAQAILRRIPVARPPARSRAPETNRSCEGQPRLRQAGWRLAYRWLSHSA